MFMEIERAARDIVFYNGHFTLIDTVKTPDAGWETGIIAIDMDRLLEETGLSMAADWNIIVNATALEEYYIGDWLIVNDYPNKKTAMANHKKFCKMPWEPSEINIAGI